MWSVPDLMQGLSPTMLLEAAAMMTGFLVALFAAALCLPGRRITGEDADGRTQTHTLNGLAMFAIVALVAGTAHLAGWMSLSILHSHFVALFVVANVFSLALSLWLYHRGRRALAAPSSFWPGAFLGLEASPAWFGIDLKFFSYRPSLIALALLNASFAVVQYETYGYLTLAMILYQAFTFLYVLNHFQFEGMMVHTWDMISERFGLMLVWGDYVLVPFFYSMAGWWLIHAPDMLSPAGAAGLVLLYALGFWLFRGANMQKHRFRSDPQTTIWGRPARSLDGRLLISGFWGVGRHLTYTGEICIYLAFTLTTGLASLFPYLLPAWLIGLLVHRSIRDERRCRAKYGELWERYTRRARFSMLPYIH